MQCGKTTLLADDFSTLRYPEVWGWAYAYPPAQLEVANGTLNIIMPSEQSGSFYGGLDSLRWLDLTDSSVSVEVVDVFNQATGALGFMQIITTTGKVLMLVSTGLLYAQYADELYPPTGNTTLRSAPFNALNHRFWRISAANGLVFWDVSSNGIDWTNFAYETLPYDFRFVLTQLAGGIYQSEFNPGTMRFDNVNGGTPVGTYCPMHTFVDTFNDGNLQPHWLRSASTPGIQVQEDGAHLVLSSVSSTGSGAAISSTSFQLENSQVAVQLVSADTTAQANTYFALRRAGNDGFQFLISGTTIQGLYQWNGMSNQVGQQTYDPEIQNWLRLRAVNTLVIWETSPNGVDWLFFGEWDVGEPLGPLDVVMGMDVVSPATLQARFDNLNLSLE